MIAALKYCRFDVFAQLIASCRVLDQLVEYPAVACEFANISGGLLAYHGLSGSITLIKEQKLV